MTELPPLMQGEIAEMEPGEELIERGQEMPPQERLQCVAKQLRYYQGQHLTKLDNPDFPADRRDDTRHKAVINGMLAEEVDRLEQDLFGPDAAVQQFDMVIREVDGPYEQYHADAMRTAAGPEVFHPGQYSVRALILSMARYIAAARHLDAAKSALFYGKAKEVDTSDISPILASGGVDGHFDFAFIANPQLLHACLGIASEGGEIAEDLLLALQGKLENCDNLVRESGDIDWFQELLAEAVEVSVYEGQRRNIYRLRQRFPDAFSEADAVARADEV